MPKKRRSSSKRKKQQTKKNKRSLMGRRWVIQLFIIGLCAFFSYCLFLDFRIRKEFEGKQWSVPARVYAQALELYTGRKYSFDLLVSRLNAAGYQKNKKLSGPGQFNTRSNHVDLYAREFHYQDGVERSKKISIQINNRHIINIVSLENNKPLNSVRLPPPLIGKIFPLHDEDRVLLGLDEVPDSLISALIAVEDRNFLNHFGVDPKGILRAIVINLLKGKFVQGGSTLTQQLVKNMFLTRERTFLRKINGMLMAIMLEYHYSKENILSAYINEIYLGQKGVRGIHGFGTAAEFYFSKPLQELSLDQIALLVGLVKGASYYNPRKHPDRAISRRNLVLELMWQQGFITQSSYQSASSQPLRVIKKSNWSSAKYPAYLDLVRRHLKRDYKKEDLRDAGLRILTTLDPDKQELIQDSISSELLKIDKQKGFDPGTLQTAMIMVDQHTGEVLALLGGREKNNNAFNRAIDAKRAIGSLIKPAVYMTALDQPDKYHVLSGLNDTAIELKQGNGKKWAPRNYDGVTHGRVPLSRSLARSYNLSTVRLGMQLGLDNVISTLKKLGVKSKIPRLPSILLGALELSPYEVTQMYQAIANDGLQIPLRTIRSVLDSDQRPLKRYESAVHEHIKPETAFLTQFLLTEVVLNGTAKRLTRELPSLMPLAGKTGTTNKLRDSWFAGFGDNVLAVVWLGRDDNQSTKLTGSNGAMQLWLNIMKQLKPAPLTLTETGKNIEWRSYPDMSEPKLSCSRIKAYPFIRKYIPVLPENACS